MDLRPAGAQEAVAAVAELRSSGRSALIVGGSTALGEAAVSAADVRLRTDALDGVVAHVPEDLTITVGAGERLARVQERLAAGGQTLPMWHPAPDRATIGGLVASGFNGLGRRLFGRLRDRVLEVRVVTGEAKLVRGGGKVVKNVTGFDLPRLYVGSMGTLGLIVEVTLKVHPGATPLFGVERTGDVPSLGRWLADGVAAARMPVEAILTVDGSGARATVLAPGPAPDAEALLSAFPGAEALPDANRCLEELARHTGFGGGVAVRSAVPPARAPELATALPERCAAVVDVGSGLAWAVLPDAEDRRRLRTAAADLGGWATAPSEGEPGAESDVHGLAARLRAQFDPDGVFARGATAVGWSD